MYGLIKFSNCCLLFSDILITKLFCCLYFDANIFHFSNNQFINKSISFSEKEFVAIAPLNVPSSINQKARAIGEVILSRYSFVTVFFPFIYNKL